MVKRGVACLLLAVFFVGLASGSGETKNKEKKGKHKYSQKAKKKKSDATVDNQQPTANSSGSYNQKLSKEFCESLQADIKYLNSEINNVLDEQSQVKHDMDNTNQSDNPDYYYELQQKSISLTNKWASLSQLRSTKQNTVDNKCH